MSSLEHRDPEIWQAIQAEEDRQQEGLEMIASENYTSVAVMERDRTGNHAPVVHTLLHQGLPGHRHPGPRRTDAAPVQPGHHPGRRQ